jgi:hypothetical protein
LQNSQSHDWMAEIDLREEFKGFGAKKITSRDLALMVASKLMTDIPKEVRDQELAQIITNFTVFPSRTNAPAWNALMNRLFDWADQEIVVAKEGRKMRRCHIVTQ